MVVILAMGIGLFAPPFGLGYHAACTIGRVSPDAALLRIWPDLGVLVLGLLLIAAIPQYGSVSAVRCPAMVGTLLDKGRPTLWKVA